MGKALFYSPLIALAFAFGVQVMLSELLTGWTRQYTSPIYFTPARSIPDLSDKVAIVTGANTGIGYNTALELARAGADVIVAARNEAKGLDAVRRIQNEIADTNGNANATMINKVQFLPLNLASLDSVEKFAKAFKALKMDLHTLVLNAGVMKSPGQMYVGEALTYGFGTTEDGFETHIGVNHIGHAYLTQLLLDDLKATAAKSKSVDGSGNGTRIVSVSSMAEQGAPESGMAFDQWLPKGGKMPDAYEDGIAYGQSKLANLMYAHELSLRLNGTGVQVFSCHPGVIASELTRYMETEMEEKNANKGKIEKIMIQAFAALFNSAIMDVKLGSFTQLHLATADLDTLVNGAFYHPIGKVTEPTHPEAKNDVLRQQLWTETNKAIQQRSKYRV